MTRSRKSRKRKIKRTIIFLVEGETEKKYFNLVSQAYRLTGAHTVKILSNSGNDWVDKAKNEITNDPNIKKIINESTDIFIIFDKDDYTKKDIDKMVEKAADIERTEKCSVCSLGMSNYAFEVWLLAHFEKINGGILSKASLNKKIGKYLGEKYIKGNVGQLRKIIKENRIFIAIENVRDVSIFDANTQSTDIGRILEKILK